MHPVTRISRLAAAAALGISLAACGSSSGSGKTAAASSPAGNPSSSSVSVPATSSSSSTSGSARIPDARTLVHEARAATKKASSAHVAGSVVEGGKATKIDAKGTMDGSNQELVIGEGGGNATIRTVDKAYYIKGDKKFWGANGGEAEASLLADRWIKSTEDPAGDLSGLTIGALLTEAIGPENIPDSELTDTTTRRTTYAGQPAYVVTQTSTGDNITISAATKYVLHLTSGTGTSSSGSLTFTGWDQQPRLTAPSGAIELPAGA